MFDMRIRLPELMAAKGITTAYALSKATRGEMTITNAQRLIASKGRPDRIALRTIQLLCDVLDVGPGDLLESESEHAKKRR